MKLPIAAPGVGNPCPVSLHKCWRRVGAVGMPWGRSEGYCARNADPEGIGLCSDHLTELRRLSDEQTQ